MRALFFIGALGGLWLLTRGTKAEDEYDVPKQTPVLLKTPVYYRVIYRLTQNSPTQGHQAKGSLGAMLREALGRVENGTYDVILSREVPGIQPVVVKEWVRGKLVIDRPMG